MATILSALRPGVIFPFDNSFARELPGFYVSLQPAVVRAPRLLFLNGPLVDDLGLDLTSLDAQAKADMFAGNTVTEGAEPLAQAYAGHQFGGFSSQLGDGRALLRCATARAVRQCQRARCMAGPLASPLRQRE